MHPKSSLLSQRLNLLNNKMNKIYQIVTQAGSANSNKIIQ